MAIFSFKKPASAERADPPTMGPHRAALVAHHVEIHDEEQKRAEAYVSINALQAAAAARRAAVDAKANEATRLQGVIDKQMAAAHQAGLPDPDLAAERAALADATREVTRLTEIMRGTVSEKTGDSMAVDEINSRLRALYSQTDRLIEAALGEMLVDAAPAYLAVEEYFLKSYRALAAIAMAKNAMAMRNHSGQFTPMGQLAIPRPQAPPFVPVFANDFEQGRWLAGEHAREQSEAQALTVAAEALIHRLSFIESA
jgi:hypothetical protein